METFSTLLALCAGNLPVTVEFPLTNASDAEFLWFLWSASEQACEQTIQTLVIRDAIALMMTPQ